MDSLVIGNGEVGKALYGVLEKHYQTYLKDKEELLVENIKFLHICYPYSEDFVEITKNYIKQYNPEFTIIHSTVPVGTTKEIGYNVRHSPVRGKHPNLEESLRTFTKYISGEYSYFIDKYFLDVGIRICFVKDSDTSEALKLWDTLQYGLLIMIQKEIYKWCQENKVDFKEVYTYPNVTYNKGYTDLGLSEVVRPYLKQIDGQIGGHCVVSNAKLLNHWLAKLLLERNKTYE